MLDERIESWWEFQIVGAAVWKKREPKIRSVRGTCKSAGEFFLIGEHLADISQRSVQQRV